MSSLGNFHIKHKSRPFTKTNCQTETLVADLNVNNSNKCFTPYRLPRLSPRVTQPAMEEASLTVEMKDRVWGQFGYECAVRNEAAQTTASSAHTRKKLDGNIVARNPKLNPNCSKLESSHPALWTAGVGAESRSLLTARDKSVLLVPKFSSAAVLPVVNPASHREMSEVYIYKSLLERTANADYSYDPTPTPVSRSMSPAKSVYSIHWALGSSNHSLFDYKGRSRNQGPYSREFTVHCTAPSNWMRMKWGRARTLIH